VRWNELSATVNTAVDLFLLTAFVGRPLGQLSGGTVRRATAALACLGRPSLILLGRRSTHSYVTRRLVSATDEPSTGTCPTASRVRHVESDGSLEGVDPHSRRRMRQIFACALACRVTLVLTSHSMDECEFLCHRLGILSDGQLLCLGSIPHLKRRFGRGYSIDMKFEQDAADVRPLLDAIETRFGASVDIRHRTDRTIVLQVDASASPGDVFSFVEQVKRRHDIESYSIAQTSLEQIFLSFERAGRSCPTE
jgi:ABC-type multidrug transport system ATPase subunit